MRLTFRKRTVEDRALSPGTVPAAMLTSAVGEQPGMTARSAIQVADVFACVRVLADAAASVPLIPYRTAGDGGRVRATGRLADLLAAPAPAVTQANLIGQLVAHLNLWGNAYLGKYRDHDGRVAQLALIPPERVSPELDAGEPRYTVTDPRQGQSVHGTADIVHIRALTLDGLVGLSPVAQCRTALNLSQGLGDHAEAFFRQGGRPSGIVKVPEGAGPDVVKGLSDGLNSRHGGARNAHKIAVLTGDVQWTAMSGPLDDLQFVEQRKLSTAEVARIFRVPPWMVGAPSGDSLTYANVEQQQLAFVTHSLRPWLVLVEQAITADRDLCAGGMYVEFLLDALLRADSATRAAIYEKALNPVTGWMRRDEVRRLENLDPEPTSAPDPAASDAAIA